MNRYITIIILNIVVATSPSTVWAVKLQQSSDIQQTIETELKKKSDLKALTQLLEKKFQNTLTQELQDLAQNEKAPEEARWVAIFSLAHHGAAAKNTTPSIQVTTAKFIVPFLNHKSWLLRDAAIKALVILRDKTFSNQILKKLDDDALIVRTTAVQAIQALELTQFEKSLTDALFSEKNFNKEKALWIHKYILDTLAHFQAKGAVPKLVELLEKSKDETLQDKVIKTLEKLSQKQFENKTIQEQKYLWRRYAMSQSSY